MSAGRVTIAAPPPSPAAAGGGRASIVDRNDGLAWRRWCRSCWGGIGLLLVCLSVYLPGLWTIPPVDRDESRFAQASRQMYESGDWVIPRVQSKPRLNKPPLIYWLQCASIAAFGDRPGQYANGNIWVFRIPSVLAAIGAVLLTWRLGLRLFDPRAAWLGAAMLAVCPMVVWDAHQARADQLLLFTTIATQFALYVIWKQNSPSQREGAGGWARASTSPEPSEESAAGNARQHHKPLLLAPILFWLSLSAGILTKGPITPMIALLTILALCITTRRWRWLLDLRPLLGVLTIAAATLPWFLTLINRLGHPSLQLTDDMRDLGFTIGGKSGWHAYARIIYEETLGRSTGAKEGHWGPPGYHLVLLTVLFWPGSLLTGLGVAHAFRRTFPSRSRTADGSSTGVSPRGSVLGRSFARLRAPNFHPASRFLLCWIIPSWLVFEFVSTKLPHYTMPLYPALALISARAVFAAHRGVLKGLRDLGTRLGFIIWWLVGIAATLGFTILIIVAGRVDQTSSILTALRPYALPGIVIAIALFAAARSLARGFYLRAQFQSLAAVVIWGATFLQVILPDAQRFWISSRLAALGDTYWMNASNFAEDSLVFLARGHVDRLDDAQLGESLRRGSILLFHGPYLVDQSSSLLNHDPARAWNLREIAAISGWNYSNGQSIKVVVTQPVHAPSEGTAP